VPRPLRGGHDVSRGVLKCTSSEVPWTRKATCSAPGHDGPSEFEIKNIRYVQGKVSDMKKGETVQAFMERIYTNSTGCLIRKDFKPL
jgi:hypothetical protein